MEFEIQQSVGGEWCTVIGGYEGYEGLAEANKDIADLRKDCPYAHPSMFRIYTYAVPN